MDPFFKIEKAPLWTVDSFGDRSEVDNRFAIVNQTNSAVLGIVSKSYEPVLNKDVYGLFESALKNVNIKKEIHHLDRDGRKWHCDFILNDGNEYDITGDGDVVGILIRAFNAYNGKNTFGYEIMGFRWLCENGQVFGKQSIFLRTFRHFIGKAEKLMKDFAPRFGIFKEHVEEWRKWTKIGYNKEKFTAFLENKEYLGERLRNELIGKVTNKHHKNMWDFYNLLTYVATHETKGKKYISGVFTNKYRIITRLVDDFGEETTF